MRSPARTADRDFEFYGISPPLMPFSSHSTIRPVGAVKLKPTRLSHTHILCYFSALESVSQVHLRNSLKTKSWSFRLEWQAEQVACRSAVNFPSVGLPPGKLVNFQPPVVR